MKIEETRINNLHNISALAKYLAVEKSVLVEYYDELIDNNLFLQQINKCIDSARNNYNFYKGIFDTGIIDSVDWFAYERVLIYILIRHFKPAKVLETGVYYGGNSAFALLALNTNKTGMLTSIDFPDSQIRESGSKSSRHALVGDSEFYNPKLKPGFMVPDYLKANWNLKEGDSLEIIPNLKDSFDFYIHDSDHSMQFLAREMDLAWDKLSEDAVILVDDIDWSNAFFSFAVKKRLYPLLCTDNGKDNLRVRTGILLKNHIRNSDPIFT